MHNGISFVQLLWNVYEILFSHWKINKTTSTAFYWRWTQRASRPDLNASMKKTQLTEVCPDIYVTCRMQPITLFNTNEAFVSKDNGWLDVCVGLEVRVQQGGLCGNQFWEDTTVQQRTAEQSREQHRAAQPRDWNVKWWPPAKTACFWTMTISQVEQFIRPKSVSVHQPLAALY